MTSRDRILTRIREALQTPSPLAHQASSELASPRRADAEARAWLPPVELDLVARFAAQSAVLKTNFIQVRDAAAAQVTLRHIAQQEGWRRVAYAEGEACIDLTSAFESDLGLFRISRGYEVKELEACDVGITGCDALVAQTGSVVLTSRHGGGRALSVLPPHHLVIARRAQLLADLPAAYDKLHQTYVNDWPSLMTVITGPSRTGDIERILVLGAHGPKKLTVLLMDD